MANSGEVTCHSRQRFGVVFTTTLRPRRGTREPFGGLELLDYRSDLGLRGPGSGSSESPE